jgi:hypothetical protein
MKSVNQLQPICGRKGYARCFQNTSNMLTSWEAWERFLPLANSTLLRVGLVLGCYYCTQNHKHQIESDFIPFSELKKYRSVNISSFLHQVMKFCLLSNISWNRAQFKKLMMILSGTKLKGKQQRLCYRSIVYVRDVIPVSCRRGSTDKPRAAHPRILSMSSCTTQRIWELRRKSQLLNSVARTVSGI